MADTAPDLSEFDLGLDERLEALYLNLGNAGFPVGVRERSIAARLVLHQATRDPKRISRASLRSDLAPVLAKSVEARAAFGSCFDDAFLAGGGPEIETLRRATDGRRTTAGGTSYPSLWTTVRWLIGGVVVATAVWWAWTTWSTWQTPQPVPAPSPTVRQSPDGRGGIDNRQATPAAPAAPSEEARARLRPIGGRLEAATRGAVAMTPRQIAVNMAAEATAPISWQTYLRAFVRDLEVAPDAPLALDDATKARLLIAASRLEGVVADIRVATASEIVKSATEPTAGERRDHSIPLLKEQFSAPWWISLIPPMIPLALLAGWLIRRTARKRAYLESRQPEAPPVVHNLVSHAFERGAADLTALAVASQRLYRRVLGTISNDLAADATVDATVSDAGRFHPVWARRKLEPEYLFLIAIDGWSDVGADRMAALVDQLRRYGLSVERYFIRLEHNLVFRSLGEANIRLADLLTRYPEHRLVFMGAGTELLNPVTFEPWPWARDIEKWEVRSVLTPVRQEEWGRREVALAGLFASPPFAATTRGLSDLAELLERSGTPEPDRFRPGGYPQPRSWRFRPLRWLEPIDEGDEQWAKLWQELRRHLLGEERGDGSSRADHPALLWLAACAIYPAVRWDLSVYLALGLTPQGTLRDTNGSALSLYDEATAVRLVELPWFREGYMPDWLRLRLVRTIDQSTRRDVVRLLEKLLEDARSPSGDGFSGVSLSFARGRLPHTAQRPLQDQVFLEEMARHGDLALEATRNIRELLGRLRESFWFREWATGLVLALYAVAAALLVPWPVDGPLPTAAWLPVTMLVLALLAWPAAKRIAGFADPVTQEGHSLLQSARQAIADTTAGMRQRYADRQEERRRRRGLIEVAVGQPSSMRWLKPAGGEPFRDMAIGPEMVVVPAGAFMMGAPSDELGRSNNEGPQHQVRIAVPFAVGRFAVTFDEWDAAQAHPDWQSLSGLEPRRPNDYGWGRGRRPVVDVSWDDAKAYCNWLSKVTGQPYRLLSEAEWEYCCRAGTTTPFWWGSEISTAQANYDGSYTYGAGVKGENRERTLPVDSFNANPWGLYQVHGNAWEWCEDPWHPSYQGAPTNGSVWTRGADTVSRVVRGGSWNDRPDGLRAASRHGGLPDDRNFDLGFRLARTLFPSP